MKTEKNLNIVSLILLLIIASCDDSRTVDVPLTLSPCQKVFNRISECVGGRVPYDGRSCDTERAESLLELDCESLLEEIR